MLTKSTYIVLCDFSSYILSIKKKNKSEFFSPLESLESHFFWSLEILAISYVKQLSLWGLFYMDQQ